MSARLAIHKLIDGRIDAGRIQAFLHGRKFPIVEGTSVTFVWMGHADSVQPPPLDLRPGVGQRPLPGPGHGPLVPHAGDPAQLARRVQVRDPPRGPQRWIEDPLNPNRARDPFGANSVLQSEGYEDPTWTNPTRSPAPARSSPSPSTARPSAAAPGTSTSRRASAARGSTRCSSCTTAATTCVRRDEDRARQPHPPPRDPRHDRGLHRLARPPAGVRQRRAPRALPHRGARPRPRGALPLYDRRRRAASWARASARSRPSPRPAATPASGGGCCCSRARFAFTDIGKRNRRGPLFDRVVEFVNAYRAQPKAVSERVFVSCGVYESLIYENRSMVPLLDRHGDGGALRRGARRPQLGKLARPPARRALLADAGSADVRLRVR
jgi:hypothetical protein